MNSTPFLPNLSPVQSKPLTALQDAGNLSSNGGLVMLREAARQLGLADMIASRLSDERNPMCVRHTYADMITARCMAIAAGYEDADDLDHLRRDPVLMMACERAPETGAGLPSQPTISRLENTADIWTLVSIAKGYIDLFCAQYRTAPAAITLDIDDTDDMVHGGQQLSMFNTHAGGTCFKPIKIFEANSGLPVLTMIRPGKRPTGEEAAKVLAFCIRRIRRNWPHVRILVRGDSHYCAPEVLDLMRTLDCDYIIGLAINPKLNAKAAPWREQCAKRWWPSLGKVRRFHTFTYRAGSWSKTEKVIARVEATALGSDARFIVTNLEGRSKHLYEKVYCARGNMENLIKDIKLYTRSDKTACHRWQANQFRLFLHMGAYWLLHRLRRAAPKRSRWRHATFATIRCVFIKIAVRVEELKSRIKMSFTEHLPHAHTLQMITSRLTAEPP